MTERPTQPADASTGELVSQAVTDISTLIRDELAMAKRDLANSGKKAGVGIGMFGLAGTLCLFGLATLIATAILAIAEGLAPWLAGAIVTVVLFIAAGVAALAGKGTLNHASDAPHERSDSIKADIAAIRRSDEGGVDDDRPGN